MRKLLSVALVIGLVLATASTVRADFVYYADAADVVYAQLDSPNCGANTACNWTGNIYFEGWSWDCNDHSRVDLSLVHVYLLDGSNHWVEQEWFGTNYTTSEVNVCGQSGNSNAGFQIIVAPPSSGYWVYQIVFESSSNTVILQDEINVVSTQP